MTALTIVANIIAKKDNIDVVKSELIKLVEMTLPEEGCITYDLHQGLENQAHFMVYEIWESHELWQAHNESKHLTAFVAETKGAFEQFTVDEMMKVNQGTLRKV